MNCDLDLAMSAAQEAAEAASETIKNYLNSGNWQVSYKSDDSPVTEVDVATEEVIRKILQDALPAAVFFGEETGKSAQSEDAALLWLVDPIDGTKSFIRNMPFYSTQIALAVDQQFVLGVSNAPAYGERLVATRDKGAWLNSQQVKARQSVQSIDDAFLSSGNLGSLAQDSDAWSRYGQLVSRVRRVRGYGDFCHYHQLCCGQCDIVVESDVNILDIAALSVAVKEAGAIMTDMTGGAIDQSTTSVLAAASESLHAEALQLLNG